jgi:hypothetical protein
VTDDPNSVADALNEAEATEATGIIFAALTAAGYEVVPAGTADRLAALTDAIEAHRAANTSNCNNLSCEKGCGHDLRLYAALDAVQSPDPKETK